MDDDYPQDQLVSFGEIHGWRLEVWKPGFWLDTYDYRICPAPVGCEHREDSAPFCGCGFSSPDDAKAAALEDFQEKMRLGHLKPRPAGGRQP